MISLACQIFSVQLCLACVLEQSSLCCALRVHTKGKGDALNRGNYRGLKLSEQTMKVLERVVEGLIRPRAEIDEMQCGFMWLYTPSFIEIGLPVLEKKI